MYVCMYVCMYIYLYIFKNDHAFSCALLTGLMGMIITRREWQTVLTTKNCFGTPEIMKHTPIPPFLGYEPH